MDRLRTIHWRNTGPVCIAIHSRAPDFTRAQVSDSIRTMAFFLPAPNSLARNAHSFEEVRPLAKEQGFSCFLSPVKKILTQGNTAQRWLKSHSGTLDTRQVMVEAIQAIADEEQEVEDQLCQPLVA